MATGGDCRFCNSELPTGAGFCPSCGRSVTDVEIPDTSQQLARPIYENTAENDLRYRITLKRVAFMTIISNGFYLYYWFYLTWKQYRDHTGEKAYPVWHALTLGVPVYDMFRMHAHTRVFKELMTRRGLVTTIPIGWAVVVVGISWIQLLIQIIILPFDSTDSLVSPGIGRAIVSEVLALGYLLLITWLLLHIQGNLNSYWRHLSSGRFLNAKIGVGEVIFAGIGVLFWINTLLTIFSQSFRNWGY